MRDKILKYMLLTGFDLSRITEELVNKMVGGLRKEFEEGFGETLPPKPEEALVLFEKTLRDRRTTFQDHCIDICAKQFDEPTIDAIIAFYESDAGKTLTQAMSTMMNDIMDAQKAWHDDTLKGIEVEFSRILGDATGLTPENLNAALDGKKDLNPAEAAPTL